MTDTSAWEIGVFSSIDAGLGVALDVAGELGVPTIQLHTPSVAMRTKKHADDFLAKIASMGIRLTAVFGGFEGESYADIPTTAATVGLVPTATRAARLAEMKEISDFTRMLHCNVAALHLGFVPDADEQPEEYAQIVDITQELTEHCRINDQALHLETGQESADHLLRFIGDVDRPNLFINFDPANMILYGTGNPIEALQKVGSFVRSVHCKDAKWAANPGQEWGSEVPLGEGDVDMKLYLTTLRDLGYRGPLTIEREIPQEPERQKTEIGHAVKLLTELRDQLL